MAACGSLEHIFDKPLPENQTFLESLSPWKHIQQSSIDELFGELHFKENNKSKNNTIHHHDVRVHSSSPGSSPSSSLSSNSASSTLPARPGINIPKNDEYRGPKKDPGSNYRQSNQKRQYRHSGDSFSSMNAESLSLCTEGLGFESFDDVEDFGKINNNCNEGQFREEREIDLTRNVRRDQNRNKSDYLKRSRICRGDFPPPISCIGRSGNPWACLKSYREDGRFILKEIRIPTQEFLHACREDGRLRLQFIHSDDEIFEDGDEDEEDGHENEEHNEKPDIAIVRVQ